MDAPSPVVSAGEQQALESTLSCDDAGALLVFLRRKKRRRRCSALVVVVVACCSGAGAGGGGVCCCTAEVDFGMGEADPLESTSCKRRLLFLPAAKLRGLRLAFANIFFWPFTE